MVPVTGLHQIIAKAVPAAVAPAHAVVPEERKFPETARHAALGGHFSHLMVIGRNIGESGERGDKVLCNGDDAVLAELLQVYVGGELADDHVGLPLFAPRYKVLKRVLFSHRCRHAAHRPMLPVLLRILVDAPQKAVGKLFGKVG